MCEQMKIFSRTIMRPTYQSAKVHWIPLYWQAASLRCGMCKLQALRVTRSYGFTQNVFRMCAMKPHSILSFEVHLNR